MNAPGNESHTGNRIYFLDNLRTAMIFLVVLYHAGVVYESSGFFAAFWIVDDPSTNIVVGIVNILIDIFIMPTIFFVSGYFVPRSIENNPGVAFLRSRLRRLWIPWLIAVLALMPIYKYIFLYSRGLPQEPWTTYFHFSNGIISQSWLWFLPALFAFDVVFWLLAKTSVRVPDISLKKGIMAVFLIGLAYSYGVTMSGGTGWTKTILFDFQNEKLLTYFLVFLLGALCARLGVFDGEPVDKRLYIAVNCIAWIPINIYFYALLGIILKPGEYYVSAQVDLLVMWVFYYVSMLAMLYILVATFRRYRRKQGRLGAVLNGSAYGVYIVHMVVIGVIALALLNTSIPSLWKYLILAISSYAASNVVVHGYRRWLKPRLTN